MRYFYIMTAILVVITSTLRAEIYKWRDDKGQIHYSQKPPAVQKSEQIQLRSPGDSKSLPVPVTNNNSRLEDQQKLLQAFDEERKSKKERRMKKEKMEARSKRNCVLASDNLRRYKTANIVYTLDGEGRRTVLSDSARKQAIERAENDVKRWCGE